MHQQSASSLVIWWTIITVIGAALSYLIAYAMGGTMLGSALGYTGDPPNATGQTFVVLFWFAGLVLSIGPLVGGGQAWVLWHFRLFKNGADWLRWISMSTLGVLLSALFLILANGIGYSVGLPYLGILLVPGILFGIAQWLELQRYVQLGKRAAWWVPANGLAWIAGVFGADLTRAVFVPQGWYGRFILHPIQTALYWAAGWVGGSIVFGVVTGIALVWLLRNSALQAKSPMAS